MKPAAKDIAFHLRGHSTGAGYLCRCPVPGHGKGRGDVRPSLAVSDGDRGLIYHCFAGCAPADIRTALDKLDFAAAPLPDRRGASRGRNIKTTTEGALALWRAARPVAGTVAETYLRSRGFHVPPPPTIRFLPGYPYSKRERFPCLVAAAQAPTRQIVAVQLTLLHPGGRRKADVDEPRRTIGPLGAGALRLAPVADHLGLAEGFETAWAAMLIHDIPTWATLGTERFLKITIPETVSRVTVFADNDAPGLAFAGRFAEAHSSLAVEIVAPDDDSDDFATVWRRRSKGSASTSTAEPCQPAGLVLHSGS